MRALQQQRQRRLALLAAEPACRPLHAQDRSQPAVGAMHRCGDRVQVHLALLHGLRPSLASHLLDLTPHLLRVGQRPVGEPLERPVGHRRARECEHHLAGRRGVGDARPADLGNARHRPAAGDEVDRDRCALARDGERRRLASRLLERRQVGPRHRAQVEAGHHVVGEPDQVRPQPVAAGAGVVLDVPAADQRREQPRHGAGVDARAPRDLVRARLARHVEEGVQHLHGALDRFQAALGGASGGRHAPY